MTRLEQIITGLQILKQYSNHVAAEHDIIYAGPDSAEIVGTSDAAKLEELGWHIDKASDCWARYV